MERIKIKNDKETVAHIPDAKRLAWWPMPVWAQAAGAVGIALCNVVTWQVFKVNRRKRARCRTVLKS
jgi:hypothetical protein